MNHKTHISYHLKTGFANTGRAAGMGISYDRYDDESGNPSFIRASGLIRFPSDSLSPGEFEAMSGAVKIIKKGETT